VIAGDDGIGGSPMIDGPFAGFSANFDITAIHITNVPVPAAVWLFGSGLVGLAGIARRNVIGRHKTRRRR
ncbi:MAG TPA: VPLPA-CTERM sorting domain-containing protein, partial [Chromatiaceae bacterium]|nr:VPLPA-CTERM sorting domain-containing protein [Chromatiaceae bacterium]